MAPCTQATTARTDITPGWRRRCFRQTWRQPQPQALLRAAAAALCAAASLAQTSKVRRGHLPPLGTSLPDPNWQTAPEGCCAEQQVGGCMPGIDVCAMNRGLKAPGAHNPLAAPHGLTHAQEAVCARLPALGQLCTLSITTPQLHVEPLSWHLAGGTAKPQSPGQHAQPPPPPVVRATGYSHEQPPLTMFMRQNVLANPWLFC